MRLWLIIGFLLGSAAAASAEGVVVNQTTCKATWLAPQTNVDGSTLTNLKEYGVYVGTAPNLLTAPVATVPAPSADPVVGAMAAWSCAGLDPGQWYFQVDAVNLSGVRSTRTAVLPFVSVAPTVAPSAPANPVITGP